ncbi:hypothetical protein GCM10009633_11490 [Janibacter melonis]|uniref:FhaA domain-containing protein n=2 Tax=Janibacter melonis TaxID=262209 RepID=UPI001E342545|nr:DUF3662 and FHA domain-containing protein [Janibacter melonis]MCB5991210.1 DUF3662 and FHA domain-containing protein [Janibacter melonis]
MSLFERMERKLERTVNGVFAKAFRSEVQPLELASAVRRAMDDRATLIGRGRTAVPNLFTIELSPGDYDRLTEYDEELEDELIAAAQEHAETQRYRPGGPLQVIFESDDELETGVFRVRPATARQRVEDPSAVREYREEYVETEGEDYDEYSAPVPQGRAQAPAAPTPAPAQAAPSADEWWDDDVEDDEWEVPTSARGAAAAPAPAPAPARAPQPRAPEPRAPEPRTPEPARAAARRPRVQDLPWLEVDGERYPLMSAMTVLGRDESADVVLDDPGISRRHAEVRVTNDGPHQVAHLRDLGSTNGSYVNGEQVDACPLHDGDRITVGRTSVIFRLARR